MSDDQLLKKDSAAWNDVLEGSTSTVVRLISFSLHMFWVTGVRFSTGATFYSPTLSAGSGFHVTSCPKGIEVSFLGI
jgi:hypothetical protein